MSEDAPNNRNLLSNEKMLDPKHGCDIISGRKSLSDKEFQSSSTYVLASCTYIIKTSPKSIWYFLIKK
jgi:hypothetical protein